jgi:tuberculosinol/isotuberculosinol synthase
MEFNTFLSLADTEVADLVRKNGPRVVVFPINGTRRWYLLEHGSPDSSVAGEPGQAGFLDVILARYVELFELIFDHGVSTLLTPILGPDIAARDASYRRLIHTALEEITGGERFREFYDRYDVRVRFYGDYQRYLDEHSPAIPERISRIQRATIGRIRHRLFWGMFAHDPVEAVGRLAIQQFEKHGRAPQRDDLVAGYYGEFIPPADVYIGMLPPRVFDYPLLDTGTTALYFTTAPSPYLTRRMLRRILFDMIYCQPEEGGYEIDDPDSLDSLRTYYQEHQGDLIGTGRLAAADRVWLPE